jgi:hypothetical protein
LQRYGSEQLIIEGDVETIIMALHDEEHNGSRYGHLIEDAKLILNSLSNWKPNLVHRNINVVAHLLAKLATQSVIDRIWRDEISNCICDIVQAEQIASP